MSDEIGECVEDLRTDLMSIFYRISSLSQVAATYLDTGNIKTLKSIDPELSNVNAMRHSINDLLEESEDVRYLLNCRMNGMRTIEEGLQEKKKQEQDRKSQEGETDPIITDN
jgi:hypothetical protein